MKIRIYTPYFPLPVTEGAFQIIADQISTFSQLGHSVEVVLVLETLIEAKIKIDALPAKENLFPYQLKSLQNHKREPYQSSSNRLRRVLSSLFSELASPELFYYPTELKERSFLGPADLAIYHYSFSYSWLRTSESLGEKKRVVYFHNLESDLSLLRAKTSVSKIQAAIHLHNSRKLRKHEKELSELCDEIWMASPKDYQNFLKTMGDPPVSARLRLTPPTYPKALKQNRTQSFLDAASKRNAKIEESNKVILGFIGGMDFGPNLDSAQWIIKNLAPALQSSHFSGKILFAGKNPPTSLLKMAEPYQFIEFLGFVENIENFWNQLSFMLVPHISGSGVRMKLLEAVASGVPVLANPEAIERTHPDVQNSPFVLNCKNVEEWMNLILREKPFQTRKSLIQAPAPHALSGTEVYGSLCL